MRSPPPNVNTISQQLNCTRFCFSLSLSIAFFLHRYFHVFVASFTLQVPFDNKISNDRRQFCPANLRSNNVVIVTIKVLLISLPKEQPNFTALCTTIQIALRREGNDYGKKNTSQISNLFAVLLKLPILLLILDGCDFNHFEWHKRHCVCMYASPSWRDSLFFFHVHYALYAIRLQIKFTPISIFQWMHIRFVSSFIGWLNDFVHNLNVIFCCNK